MAHVPGVSDFLKIPDNAGRDECYRQFYITTSMDATRTAVCTICAQEMGAVEGCVQRMKWSDIPNRQRLIPKNKHAAHELFEGCLLQLVGVHRTVDDGVTYIDTCHCCLESLRGNMDKAPPWSLANNLWVGSIPWELRRLTLPEQMLIALLYPKIYVFKLFPKMCGQGTDPSTLQRAMAGTVSTYDLDVAGATDMIKGNLLPRKLPILASLVSITFISTATVPKRWLHSMFWVRRQVVHNALMWLKTNNTKYYGSIEISASNICNLPVDNVPKEVLGVVKQLMEVVALDGDEGGYVPEHDAPLSGK